MVDQKLPLDAGKSVILQIKLDLIWKNYQFEKYLNLFYLSSVVLKIKWIHNWCHRLVMNHLEW